MDSSTAGEQITAAAGAACRTIRRPDMSSRIHFELLSWRIAAITACALAPNAVSGCVPSCRSDAGMAPLDSVCEQRGHHGPAHVPIHEDATRSVGGQWRAIGE